VDDAQVARLHRHLTAARHPVIVAGHGCIRAGAQALVQALSEHLGAPVATSLKGKGVVDERSPLSLGSLGVTSGGYACRYIREHADLVLFLGAAFNERTSYTWDEALLAGCTVLQVDLDPAQLEKGFRAEVAVAGDVAEVLTELLARLDDAPPEATPAAVDPGQANTERSRVTNAFLADFELVERFFAELARRIEEPVMVFDDNIIFAQNFFQASAGNRYFPNSGISSLGHAIPAAIGARFSERTPVFAILGDGGFQMCGMELMTAVNYGIPVNVVLFNNSTMGLIRKNQFQQYGERYIDCDFVNPDYAKLADAFGIAHWRVETEEDIPPLFDQLDLAQGINLIEIVIDKDAFPDYRTSR
jgi:acetolactate synthase-1/2/3 large subunit